MDAISAYHSKRGQYLPVIFKGDGKFTRYIEGYPVEEETMPGGGCHGEQVATTYTQLKGHFADLPVYVGSESFVYYREGDIRKKVAPDAYVIFGVEPAQRSSFYIWKEKAAPRVVIEFLSEGTEDNDRVDKWKIYFEEIGVTEYFIHQPDGEQPVEFCGWRRTGDGKIEALQKDDLGRLFSAELNLWLMFVMQPNKTRLLRPYLPDGTPVPTYDEYYRADKENKQTLAKMRAFAEEALARAEEDAIARREAEAKTQQEAIARREAEKRLQAEVEKGTQLEAELERLRSLLASRFDDAT
ncbi:Uma2 family endonuclease [Candidatus Poribacteria bacterium]|nr:Uma2 family endonuclease [Candidatus Poribacteria bacterium]